MSEPLKVGDVLRGPEGWLYVVEEVEDEQAKVKAFSVIPTHWAKSWIGFDTLLNHATLIARAVEPPNIMTRIEKAAHRYLAENARAPHVVILGSKEWDALDAQVDCLLRHPSALTNPPTHMVQGLRVVRDAERDSCLEVYG